jgi:hypothetical protein
VRGAFGVRVRSPTWAEPLNYMSPSTRTVSRGGILQHRRIGNGLIVLWPWRASCVVRAAAISRREGLFGGRFPHARGIGGIGNDLVPRRKNQAVCPMLTKSLDKAYLVDSVCGWR